MGQETWNPSKREIEELKKANLDELLSNEIHEVKERPQSERRAPNSRRDAKSEYQGVTWCNRKMMWHGRIWIKKEKRLHWVGYFDNEIDCAKAINAACIEKNIPIKNPQIPLKTPVYSDISS